MDVPSNTTDPEVFIDLDSDDREYYNFSGHIVHEHPSRAEQAEHKLLVQSGLS
jgi:hypothetical protein